MISAITTTIGLFLQLNYANSGNLALCLVGFSISIVSIEIMDGAALSLAELFLPSFMLNENSFLNSSFIHVIVGTLGRTMGCLSIYIPFLIN